MGRGGFRGQGQLCCSRSLRNVLVTPACQRSSHEHACHLPRGQVASGVTSPAASVDLTREFSHLKIHLILGTPRLSDKLLFKALPDPQSLRACRHSPPWLPGKQCLNLSCYLLVSTCSAKENNYYGLGGKGQSILDLPALEVGLLAKEIDRRHELLPDVGAIG